MIPILYYNGETEFTSNGLGRLADCLSCTVTEERNGIYECQFQYPVTGEMYPEIQEGRIIGVIHDDAQDVQPFDIYSRSAPLKGVVTFYAHHISYRLGNIVLKPMTAPSCAAALAAIPNNTYTSCPFTFWTDKSVATNWTNEVPNPVKAILGGQQGSILDVYGKGEYEWDKWSVKLYVNRGNDNGVSIRYGVNLTDLQHDIDTSGVYAAVVPYWKNSEDNTVVTLDGGYVKVSSDPLLVKWTDDIGNEITDDQGAFIEFNAEEAGTHLKSTVMDLSDAFKEQPTQEQLRAEALRRLTNSEAWLPSENIKVSFVDLSRTEEYKNVAALQRVRLCDRVSVYCGPLDVSAVSMQVIKVVFNVLTEQYDEIELGAAKTSFTQAVVAQVEEVTKDLPSVSMMQQAINSATDKITGAKGGHVRFIYDANGDPQEILIMDTEDVETAVNVWRWNSGGLGFSSNGYAGPYALAMTADGKIVADMIKTGELDADLITAGHLSADRIKGGTIDGEYVNAKLLQILNSRNAVIATFADVIRLGVNTSNYAEITPISLKFYLNDGLRFFVGTLNDHDSGRAILTESTTVQNGNRTYSTLSKNHIRRLISLNVGGTELDVTECTIYYSAFGFPSDFPTPPNGTPLTYVYETDTMVQRYDLGTRINEANIGKSSYALGESVQASGELSIAEGFETKTEGKCSHAFGTATWAKGDNSIAAGEGTFTNGNDSVALGVGTRAVCREQFVFGRYNVDDPIGQLAPHQLGYYVEIVGNGSLATTETVSNARTLTWGGNEWIAGTLTQASDARLKEEHGEVPDVSSIRARRFRWNDKKVSGDDRDHIGYFAQDVEKVAPYLVGEDASGYKSLDYIALLCAKIEALERKVAELEKEVK